MIAQISVLEKHLPIGTACLKSPQKYCLWYREMCKIIGVPVINSSSGEMTLYFASMPDFMIILFFGALCKVAHVLENEVILGTYFF